MIETLSNLLRSVVALSPLDLLPVLYLSLNRLGPPQQGLELGIGDGVLLKAVAQATGRRDQQDGHLEGVKSCMGDVGKAATGKEYLTARFSRSGQYKVGKHGLCWGRSCEIERRGEERHWA